MLVLSRYCDESIYIGDDIIVTVVDIRGDRVRLGIQAPSDVSVHRQEIYDAIVRERKEFEGEAESSQNGRSRRPQSSMSPPLEQSRKPRRNAAPLENPLAAQSGKGLPVDIDTSGISFGGISDIVTR